MIPVTYTSTKELSTKECATEQGEGLCVGFVCRGMNFPVTYAIIATSDGRLIETELWNVKVRS